MKKTAEGGSTNQEVTEEVGLRKATLKIVSIKNTPSPPIHQEILEKKVAQTAKEGRQVKEKDFIAKTQSKRSG